jgi:hypothetical protein
MATYKVLAASVSGSNGHPVREGQYVDISRLNEATIESLIASGAIVEVSPVTHTTTAAIEGNGIMETTIEEELDGE